MDPSFGQWTNNGPLYDPSLSGPDQDSSQTTDHFELNTDQDCM
jgi:hypothetical protein